LPFVNEAKRRGLKCFAAFERPGRDADSLTKLGNNYFNEGQYQKAIASYQSAIRIDQKYIQAHYNLALTYIKLGKNLTAIASYKNILRINPNHKHARNNLNILEQNTEKPSTLPPISQPTEEQAQIAQSQKPHKTFQQVYSGTGFMFGSKDYVITNWHVIRGAKNIKVKFLNGEKINAEVILKDSKNDIAFLKLDRSPKLPASSLKVGDSSNVRMGDKVFTIGYPAHWVMGKNPKYTEGVVNALSGIKDDPTVFQISAQIQPGNSGGPIFDQSGNIIGIAQASLDPQLATESIGALPQNVNYAIKSTYIKKLFPMLPETLVSNRGIVVVPSEPKNSLANFIDKAKNNIVLIEASTK
jgi:S1-C subfamily serine protease